jgi:hypothetical protein
MLLVAVQGPGLSKPVHSIPTDDLIALLDGRSSPRPLTLWFIDTHVVATRTLSSLSSPSSIGMASPGDLVGSNRSSSSGGPPPSRSSSLSPHGATRSASVASEAPSSSASLVPSPDSHLSQSHSADVGVLGHTNHDVSGSTPWASATTDLGVDLVINLSVRGIASLGLVYLLYGAVPLEHQAPLLVVGWFTYFVWAETSIDRIWARQRARP